MKPKTDLKDIYDENFYKKHIEKSFSSAVPYAEMMVSLLNPTSVVDVGCGWGTWLTAFKKQGVLNLHGVDGPWNSQDKMIDDDIVFTGIDLNYPPLKFKRFDLAMSLEVAEHLDPASAPRFVKFLTDLSDVILFGAAYLKQGGKNHINEQRHSYWAELFNQNGYQVFDLFRENFWENKKIEFWYQQNTFLYVRGGCDFFKTLHENGVFPVKNLKFLNCIHPELYSKWLKKNRK